MTRLPRSTRNFLAQQLRDQGLLPRSMREVKAQFRKSGEILPPYEQTDDPPTATDESRDPAPQKQSRSYERKTDRSVAITPAEYSGLQEAYDHFNNEQFGGELPDVFITYQRRAHSRGYFGADRFSERGGKSGRHELALNPDHFVDRTDEQICSTLVHEMCHVWQHMNGTAPSRNYHNKEWAAKMKSLGLQPSSTGAPGGKETGASISHYIIPDGAFQKAFEKLATVGWKLSLQSAHQAGAKGGKNSKTKFTCPECRQNCWGRPDLAVICKPCRVEMKSAEGKAEVATAA
jgi:predicted SprT family Zn-dependent metalloprotease